MAGLEVVVRPVVFPDIRPPATRSLPPADDPEKGFAVIHGQGAKQIDLSNSYSASTSTSQHKEQRRRVDRARTYQKNADGTVNRKNFVDIDVANKIWMEGPGEPRAGGAPVGGEGTAAGAEGGGGGGGYSNEITIENYARVKEADNIEILKTNLIVENPKGGG